MIVAKLRGARERMKAKEGRAERKKRYCDISMVGLSDHTERERGQVTAAPHTKCLAPALPTYSGASTHLIKRARTAGISSLPIVSLEIQACAPQRNASLGELASTFRE